MSRSSISSRCVDDSGDLGAVAVGSGSDRSAAAHAVDLSPISLRRAACSTVTHGERRLVGVVAFGWDWAVILEALGGGDGIDSLGDERGDIDDPLASVDASLDMIADSDG